MGVKENLLQVLKSLPEEVNLVATSKAKPAEMILDAYSEGQRIFGENKVQELREKAESLPNDIHWHFIGHLQSNKVKYIAPFISLIHAVDSIKLLKTIHKEAVKNNRIIDCLLQFHVADETTKFGFTIDKLKAELSVELMQSLTNVRIVGIMGMATKTTDETKVEQEFAELHSYFEELKNSFFVDCDYFKELSMGMSNDYLIAIGQGSTLVRVGSSIFNYD